jgi:isopentenyl phosphate kinase
MPSLVFLKLGGSLITDKTRPYTVRTDRLADLARQIAQALSAAPELSLVLGHGSGSFGHAAAKQAGFRPDSTRAGGIRITSDSPDAGEGAGGRNWRGFSEVWFQASALNRRVMEALHGSGVDAIALAPSGAVAAKEGRVVSWNLEALLSALEAGIVPVIYGDVVFDQARGWTILSTEDLFMHLAEELRPQRILLAGLEAAVWADYPERTRRAEHITPANYHEIAVALGASAGPDVTGGMESKVRQMLGLAEALPGLTVQLFSGEEPENVVRALGGEVLGSLISAT